MRSEPPSSCEPRLGTTIQFETLAMQNANGHVYSQAAIALGASDQAIGGVPLPIPLNAFSPLWCGEILQSSEVYVPAPPGTWQDQTVFVPLTIPDEPSLLGMTVFAQAFIAAYCSGYCAPGTSPAIYASDAARLVIGL